MLSIYRSIFFTLEGCGDNKCLWSVDNKGRKRLWSEFRDIAGFSEKFWCLGGDFTVTRWSSDRSSGARITRSMRKFNRIIEELDLLEVPLSNGKFTWSRMGDDSTHSLLDRFFHSREWDNLFNTSSVSRGERITSDHFPIILDAGDCNWGPSPFRFYNSWLENKECVSIIESKLLKDRSYGWAGFVISSKLRNLK